MAGDVRCRKRSRTTSTQQAESPQKCCRSASCMQVAAQRSAHGAKPAGNPHVGLHDVPFLGVAPCEQDAAPVCTTFHGQAIERQRQHVATDTFLQLQAPTPALPNSPTPNGPADSRSSSHSSSSSSSSSSRLRDGLIEQSPYCLTAVSLDGRHCFQSPRSAQYFGDLKAQAVEGGEEARAGLATDVLHRLFALEGEVVLEEMLSVVLGGEDAGRQIGQRNWCKVRWAGGHAEKALASTVTELACNWMAQSTSELMTVHQTCGDAHQRFPAKLFAPAGHPCAPLLPHRGSTGSCAASTGQGSQHI